MHSEGGPQIGIESTIPLRQPRWHAAVDVDVNILPWLRVDQWSMLDKYGLFLRTLSKIVYHRLKKVEKKCARTDLAPKLLRLYSRS